MKHAFIFGTSIFLSSQNTVSLANDDNNIEFLRILSFYKHQQGMADHVLSVDANISSASGEQISIRGNRIEEGTGANMHIEAEANRVRVFQSGHHEPVLDVYQLNEHEFHGLSSHILNEIEAQHPDAVVSIKGDFKASGVHFFIENEKMFVNSNGYANGVENAHDGIILTPGEAADY